MPQRTNKFQQLIASIHSQLEHGATVTESKLIRDRVTNVEREVDVVIEVPTQLYTFTIGIECRDRSRPASLEWVNEASAKHKNLTDKLVLVSHAGFYEPAKFEAAMLGIETLTLEQAEVADWTQVVNKLARVQITLPRFQLTHLIIQLAVVSHAITYQSIVHASDGVPQGNVAEVLWAALERQMDNPNKREMVFRTLQNHNSFPLGVDAPQQLGAYVVDDTGTRHPVTMVRGVVIVHAEPPILVDLRTAMYKGVHVAYGTVPTQGGEGQLTIVEAPNQALSADLQLPPEVPKKQTERRKHRAAD